MPVQQDSWIAAIRRGDYEAAWRISDAISAARNPAEQDDPTLPYHQRWVWDGRPVDARHVLVRCYHGLGDTLQFARFLPALRARAGYVTLEIQPELFALFSGMPGAGTAIAFDRLIAFDQAAPAKSPGCDIEIMELFHALRMPPEAAPVPYVHAGPGLPTQSLPAQSLPAPGSMRPDLPGSGFPLLWPGSDGSETGLSASGVSMQGAIGICWQAGGWDAARSLEPRHLAPVLATLRAAGRFAVSLQPGPVPPELDGSFCNPRGCPRAIAQTAALIGKLSLVITVDSMVAHLAGALGHPVFLLLKHDADWRWMAGAEGSPPVPSPPVLSPWYPSMHLFRQPAPGDWHSVIAQVVRALSANSSRSHAHLRQIPQPGSASPAQSRSAAENPAARPGNAPAPP
jgi:hypothetical protein